jgi:uncharacterized protein YacL
LKKFIQFLIVLVGISLGPVLVAIIYAVAAGVGMGNLYSLVLPWVTLIIFISSAIISGIIFFLISTNLAEKIVSGIQNLEHRLSVLPSSVIFPGVLGLIVGLLISFLLSGLINNIPIPGVSTIISVLVYIIFCYLGISMAIKRKSEMHWFNFSRSGKKEKPVREAVNSPKVLDTSVIIDGRIFDLCKAGFIEGTIVIPEFVLEELRHIADSSDNLKRNRGRRGLDVLNKIQKELDLPVNIMHTDYDDAMEVDSKLLRLAKDIGGKVLTNDYNLNKVAAVQNVSVLNINELANAIKPVVLPGEEMLVQVVKEGKEAGQGVAYLDDGTMIVVEGARDRMNEELRVLVTSVLQTSAGRMIFARLKGEDDE